ncbi:MAG: hypothetical protein UX20_C0025G0004 [Candidatus Magasanikbacteria bacterium GW2011_GWC2_45_8]|uniref:Uncharacterized protein n=1 Tax=Candidatus Magasanikbacteria bacterium GW2011_GWC2_45_8 TaxID=1619050 RepID=A0A0G1MYI8_9BACT|nr:MAG: hypothetical protein UX20_C0025G0004 [Candidatus Magasanikbacteria bacterium GW2011_GWC2_45_8]
MPYSLQDRFILRENCAPIGTRKEAWCALAQGFLAIHNDRLYLTVIHAREPDAEVFFPDYSDFEKVIFKEDHCVGSLNFTYITLERI